MDLNIANFHATGNLPIVYCESGLYMLFKVISFFSGSFTHIHMLNPAHLLVPLALALSLNVSGLARISGTIVGFSFRGTRWLWMPWAQSCCA